MQTCIGLLTARCPSAAGAVEDYSDDIDGKSIENYVANNVILADGPPQQKDSSKHLSASKENASNELQLDVELGQLVEQEHQDVEHATASEPVPVKNEVQMVVFGSAQMDPSVSESAPIADVEVLGKRKRGRPFGTTKSNKAPKLSGAQRKQLVKHETTEREA